MFGLSMRRRKLGRLKVLLPGSVRGARSPSRDPKCSDDSSEGVAPVGGGSDELNAQCTSSSPEVHNSASGKSENWMAPSVFGDKPRPRFNHAATVIGNKMIVVGGDSGTGLLEDVQVLDFDRFSWTTASSKLYLSPTNLPLKIPACKGHNLISWGKKALLVGGKLNPASERLSVWAFDSDTECWSLMEAKGEIPVARSGHTVVRASSVLIIFGGEDAKRKKLNDLHMFDLKSLTWLPLHCTGPGPSPRFNHAAALYDDRILLIFGGTSKSKTLNDLYSLDFETMVWSRIKTRGYHPSPRAGCCGVLYGTKWYIIGGGSRKRRHAETIIFDVLKVEWSLALSSPPSSVIANKGFSLVLVANKEKDFLVAFGGYKKDSSNQVEVLTMEKNELSADQHPTSNKGPENLLSDSNSSFAGLTSPVITGASQLDPVARKNIVSAIEKHGSGRKSLSETLLVDSNSVANNLSIHKQFHIEEEHTRPVRMAKGIEDQSSSLQGAESRSKQFDIGFQTHVSGGKISVGEMCSVFECESLKTHSQGNVHPSPDDDILGLDSNGKSGVLSTSSSLYQFYEAKVAALIRKNGILEGQLAAARSNRETAEKNLSSALKSRQEMERKLGDTLKEMEMLKEKLAAIESAQEEANSLSNIVHSDNVRLEHDVAFLKAVLDDTQKELHSNRGVLAGERARAFQLQVEVFHLKQRMQSLENRAPTPRKPFHA